MAWKNTVICSYKAMKWKINAENIYTFEYTYTIEFRLIEYCNTRLYQNFTSFTYYKLFLNFYVETEYREIHKARLRLRFILSNAKALRINYLRHGCLKLYYKSSSTFGSFSPLSHTLSSLSKLDWNDFSEQLFIA